MPSLAGLTNFYRQNVQMSSSGRWRPDDSSNAGNLPPGLNADSHELQDRYPTNKSRDDVVPHPDPYYTPYLGLRARLSQVWINKWTVLLLLILVRVLIAIKDLDHDIGNARTQALSACKSVENVGSAMASMPHYMSEGVNAMAAKGVETAVEALMDMLMLAVTAVGEIALFILNLLYGTYICLITLVVGGAMSAALEIVEKAGEFVSKAVNSGTEEIANAAQGFQDSINSVSKFVTGLSDTFGHEVDFPVLNFTSEINDLKNIQLNSSVLTSDLEGLKDNIPNFDEVRNFTDTLIRTPFELVKKLINESTIGYKFDKSVFPVAEKQALSFCSDNNGINDFFDGLIDTAHAAKKIFLGVIIALAILVCVPMAWREIRRFRLQEQAAKLIQNRSLYPMDSVYIASRPYTSKAGLKLSRRFRDFRKQVLVRWFVAYITSVPALFVLMLGVAGLLSCLLQYILLRQIDAETPALAAQVDAFTGQVVTALDNASSQWAIGANSVIKSTNDEVNNDVFGWVNSTTTSVNDTLNYFVDGTQKVLNDTFGGTILYTPIQETLKCLIFLKIQGIQNALTWVSDNAHISMPTFEPDVFSLGAAASLDKSGDGQTFLSSPGSGVADDITGAVAKLTDFMREGIEEEVWISLALIGVYVFIILIALTRVIIGTLSREKTRAEGGGPANIHPDTVFPASVVDDERQSRSLDGRTIAAFDDVAESAHPSREAAGFAPSYPGEKTEAPLGMRRMEVPVERVRRVDGAGHARASSVGVVYEDEKRAEPRTMV